MARAAAAALPAAALPIKNTFIDFSPVCRDFHGCLPGNRSCRSCPGGIGFPWAESCEADPDLDSLASTEADEEADPDRQADTEAGTESDLRSDCSTADTVEERPEAAGAGALPSAGSAGHAAGECRPCAFLHKQRGCSLGVDCPFCHLCAGGEKRRRQKEKRALAPAAGAGAARRGVDRGAPLGQKSLG